MTNKALIVAVWDYGTYAETLTAPKYEMEQWVRLLSDGPYNFKITRLENEEATRQAVEDGLRELIKDAQKDEQRMCIFIGHGGTVPTGYPGEAEQALIASPLASGVLDAAVRESAVREIFETTPYSPEADITLVLECCHSADFANARRLRTIARADSAAATAIPLAIFPVMPMDSITRLAHFGDFAEDGGGYARPVIFAATGKDDEAVEITDGGTRRTLFSSRLLGQLLEARDSFINLRDSINPLHPDFAQEARLGGNDSRWTEGFPGDPLSTGTMRRSEPSDFTLETVARGKSAEDTDNTNLHMRVMGLATFVDRRSVDVPYKVRIILPFDEGLFVPEKDLHIACIEVEDREIRTKSGPLVTKPAKQYTRAGLDYTRWLLNGYLVTIRQGDTSKPFTRSEGYRAHVPKLIDVAPELEPYPPDDACFEKAPLLKRLASFVNIPSGSVDIGPLQPRATTYERLISGRRTFGPIVTPRSVMVTVPVLSSYPTIVLRPYLDPTKEDLVLELVPGATVLVANAREADITGSGDGDVSREQFRLYYKLARKEPSDPPVPSVFGVPQDDCTVTDYP